MSEHVRIVMEWVANVALVVCVATAIWAGVSIARLNRRFNAWKRRADKRQAAIDAAWARGDEAAAMAIHDRFMRDSPDSPIPDEPEPLRVVVLGERRGER